MALGWCGVCMDGVGRGGEGVDGRGKGWGAEQMRSAREKGLQGCGKRCGFVSQHMEWLQLPVFMQSWLSCVIITLPAPAAPCCCWADV